MFCRNCGKELIGSPEICPNCGAKPLSGTSFCPSCGATTTELTEMCTKCGARVAGKAAAEGGTWMPVTAGILDLLVGVPTLFLGIFFVAGVELAGWAVGIFGLGVLIGGPLIFFAIMAIVGGIFALRKRVWGLALAGSIFAFFAFFILGIPAIVFTAMGKRHFK